jgi:hypothetical protein
LWELLFTTTLLGLDDVPTKLSDNMTVVSHIHANTSLAADIPADAGNVLWEAPPFEAVP